MAIPFNTRSKQALVLVPGPLQGLVDGQRHLGPAGHIAHPLIRPLALIAPSSVRAGAFRFTVPIYKLRLTCFRSPDSLLMAGSFLVPNTRFFRKNFPYPGNEGSLCCFN